MAAKYRAQFDGIGKQGESTKTGGGTKNEFGSGRSKGHGDGAAKSWQRDGDWLCPNTGCGNVNFAFRGVCNRCEAARPAGVSGTGAGNGGRGCAMRPGGRVNTTSAVKKFFQTVKVEMSVDDWKKWCQFKRMYMEDKKSTETSNAFTSAASTNSGGNKYHTMSYYNPVDIPWLIDSGASRHMAGSQENFVDYAPDSKRQSVRLADGSSQTVLGSGTIMCGSNMPLLSVLHVPSFPINLLSISCITRELNCAVIFFPTWCLFLELGTWKILGTGIMRDGLYYLDDDMAPMAAAVLSQSPLEEFLHHRRLGHMSFNTLGQLYPNLYNKLCKESLVCDACQYGKLTRSIYTSSDHRSMVPFQTIHSDVWGPSGVWSLYGYKSFVTFIDCCTRTTWVYVLRNKSDVFECFKDFHNLIKNQYDARVKIFRTDNGTEYVNNQFDEYLSSFGIIHQTSCPGTSQQNGLAERKNSNV